MTKHNQKVIKLSLAARVSLAAKLARYCCAKFKELGSTKSWWVSYLMKKDDETLLVYETECFIRTAVDGDEADLSFLDDLVTGDSGDEDA